jgi:type II secretory pathway component PulF
MAQFAYKARRRSGELIEGVLDVADRSAALSQIERLGLFPVAVQASKTAPKPAKVSAAAAAAAAAADGKSGIPKAFQSLLKRKRKPKLQELAMYTQQMANLLKAGMPLTMALQSMCSLSTKGIPSEVSKQLRQDVTEGKSLSDSMARQSEIFPDLAVNMVRAGEQSGAIEQVLRRLAAHYDRFAEVQMRVKSAMIYPIIVSCVGLGLVTFFMTVMLPKFMDLFQSQKIELPTITKMLIAISHFFTGYWWAIILFVVGVVVVYRRYSATESGRQTLDIVKMRMPIFGHVTRLNLFGQFARTLSTLLENGVPVLQALRITEQIIPNIVVRRAIAETRDAVTDGKTLAQPLAKSKLFPQLMIDLIKIGEETGNVPASLNNVAETYENELNMALRTMMNLIEPIMIVGIAIMVGFLLLGVMSAMFKITESIQR